MSSLLALFLLQATEIWVGPGQCLGMRLGKVCANSNLKNVGHCRDESEGGMHTFIPPVYTLQTFVFTELLSSTYRKDLSILPEKNAIKMPCLANHIKY